jgi:hypothetical protein
MHYLSEIKQFYDNNIRPYIGKPHGCTKRDVLNLEKEIGFALPDAYKEYLLWMGTDVEGIFRGLDYFFDDIIDNTKYLPELLAENHVRFALPEHYLAFFGGQGYQYTWFNLPKESEDPTAYYFCESEKSNEVVRVGSFTETLFKEMRGFATFLPQLYKRRLLSRFSL